jgi:hypothetical protein
MSRILRLFWMGAVFPAFLWAQEKPAIIESKKCEDTTKTVEACKSEEVYIQKTFSEGGKDIYAEIYDNTKKLVAVNIASKSGLVANCTNTESNQMRCEYIDILDQSGLHSSIKAAQNYKVYQSDKDLAKALGLKESEVSALGIDWDFSQVVVWATKSPKSKSFTVTAGEPFFLTDKKNSGTVVMPFYESCPHGGIPGSEATPASALTVVAVLVPNYFKVTGAKSSLEKAGFAFSMCNKIPSHPMTPPKP